MRNSYLYIFSALAVLLAFTAYQRTKPNSKLPETLPQDPLVQVYFNNSQSSQYKESYRNQTRPGDDLEKQIVEAIYKAKFTIDIAVQEFRLPKLAQALVEKQKAGVKVRVILENSFHRPWSSLTPAEIEKLPKRERDRYDDYRYFTDINRDGKLTPAEINQRDALVILQNGKIPKLDDTADGSKGSGLMHHKFAIFDNRMVILTSANFTLSDTSGDYSKSQSLGNPNNLLKIESLEVAQLFTEEFNIMWGDGPGGKQDSKFGLKKPVRSPQTVVLPNNKITIHFSPVSPTQPWTTTSNGLIGNMLKSATKSTDMALFVFSDQRLANILEKRHQQNVKIRALLDPNFSYRFYSEGLDLMGVALSDKCKYEMDNHPWQDPITSVGIPILPRGDLLHHKFGVVDKQIVITGSHNWTEAGNHGNDEALLIIENPTVAAHYQKEFERLYANSRRGVPQRVQEKIKAQLKKCSQIKSPSELDKYLTEAVNLNTATAEELEKLPGVGKKLAQRIIIARQQKKFTSLNDLDRVPGISSKMLQKLEDKVTW